MIIDHKSIVRQVPVIVRKGKNAGKIAGHIYFERGRDPYYFIIKDWKKDQIYLAPKHKNTLSISEHILEFLIKFGVTKAIFLITGNGPSFYYIVPIKDFLEGEITDYDDRQHRIRVDRLIRYSPDQGVLSLG